MDPDRLRRLALDPEVSRVELARWITDHGVGPGSDAQVRSLQDLALELRELDGGDTLHRLAEQRAADAFARSWGMRRGWRFAREHHLLTQLHLVHAARLLRARARIRRRGSDVRLHGMSFLGRRVELTAPRGHGRLIVGPWCWIGDGVALRSHAGRVTIGAKAVIGGGTVVNSYLDVSIGEGALFADDVHITDFDHRTERCDVPIKDQGIVTSPVRIGADVWLGRGVTVLRGVDIGEGSVIGAHAVVTRDIPAYSVAVGAPARVVRSRLSDGRP